MTDIRVGTTVESLIEPVGLLGGVVGVGSPYALFPMILVRWEDDSEAYEYIEDEGDEYRVISL